MSAITSTFEPTVKAAIGKPIFATNQIAIITAVKKTYEATFTSTK